MLDLRKLMYNFVLDDFLAAIPKDGQFLIPPFLNHKEFAGKILLKPANDGFDEYRHEYNEMLLDKMQQGQNGISTKKQQSDFSAPRIN